MVTLSGPDGSPYRLAPSKIIALGLNYLDHIAESQSVKAMMAHAFSCVVSQRSPLRAVISQRTALGARLFFGSSPKTWRCLRAS